jgi:hypothetical protein
VHTYILQPPSSSLFASDREDSQQSIQNAASGDEAGWEERFGIHFIHQSHM